MQFFQVFFFYRIFEGITVCMYCTFLYRSIKSQCVGLFPVNRAGRGVAVTRAANIGFPITVYPWLLLRDHNTTSAFPHSISTYSIFLCVFLPQVSPYLIYLRSSICVEIDPLEEDEKGDGDSLITIKDPPWPLHMTPSHRKAFLPLPPPNC